MDTDCRIQHLHIRIYTYLDGKMKKAADTAVQISCAVENTGSCEGDEVVQLYLRDEYASPDKTSKRTGRFKRIHLRKGEKKKTVCFEVKTDQMAFSGH